MQISPSSAVAVFTSWKKADILQRGASGNWGVSAGRILQNKYLVVIRNRHSDWAPDDVDHGTAFLVGQISGVLETDQKTADGRPRYAIAFDTYAEVSIPDAWGKSRNPVSFIDIKDIGIDISKLTFVDVKTENAATIKEIAPSQDGISFAEARHGLATRYGVSPQKVEIRIIG